jgi:hypothetical protein
LPEITLELSIDTAIIAIGLNENHATLSSYYLKKDLAFYSLNLSSLHKLNNKKLHFSVNFLSSKYPNQPPT